MTTQSSKMSCPHCGKTCDGQSGHGSRRPKSGDYSLCWGCRRLAVFASTPAGPMLRLPSPEEGREALKNPQILRALRAMSGADDPQEAELLFQALGGGQPE